jgi:N-methylhydantoinase B/oxoprolinase/acetone carboxylase alpha subunit
MLHTDSPASTRRAASLMRTTSSATCWVMGARRARGELAAARRDESRAERLPDKCTLRMKPGDVLRMLTPGGGGWGSPP